MGIGGLRPSPALFDLGGCNPADCATASAPVGALVEDGARSAGTRGYEGRSLAITIDFAAVADGMNYQDFFYVRPGDA